MLEFSERKVYYSYICQYEKNVNINKIMRIMVITVLILKMIITSLAFNTFFPLHSMDQVSDGLVVDSLVTKALMKPACLNKVDRTKLQWAGNVPITNEFVKEKCISALRF